MPETAQLALWQQRQRPLATRYAEWRATADGKDVFARVEQMALYAQRTGEQRIEINLLFAQVRRERKRAADNSFRAYLARELIAKHPQLVGVIRVKKRSGDTA